MPVYKKPSLSSATIVKCSVCLKDTTNFKQLPCDHKFCQNCIDRQISQLSSALDSFKHVTIVCPYCRDFFLSSVGFLQDTSRKSATRPKSSSSSDHSLLQPKEYRIGSASHKQAVIDGKRERCQPCKEGGEYMMSSFWCQNCSEFLCSTCARFHKTMKMSKGHIVKTIRDKERYEHVTPRASQSARPASARVTDSKTKSSSGSKDQGLHKCDPCKQGKKVKEARYLCDDCKEKLCVDCSQCHRSMKMSKTHKLIMIEEALSKPDTHFTLGMKCEKHYGEVLSLFCKRCQSSCCAICAITVHNNCGSNKKLHSSTSRDTTQSKPASFNEYKQRQIGRQETERKSDILDKNGVARDATVLTPGRSVKFDAKSTATPLKTKGTTCNVPANRMEHRKTRINVGSDTKGDWVISLALLSCGDILYTELYQPTLKMIDSRGAILSTCSFYGDPWSVAVYNDSLAAVTFSDRKQIQLINISLDGLRTGKKLCTRHKSLAVCFAKDLIVTSCWEGCIHVMNIIGDEICSISKDIHGDQLFTNPEYIASDKAGTTIYVSDYKRSTVTALKLLPNRIDSKPLFVFSDKGLEGPKGIAVDREGMIYISGMSSRNIFRLTPSGQKIQVYRRSEDVDYYEALAVSPTVDKLYVSAYEDDTIIVFKMTK